MGQMAVRRANPAIVEQIVENQEADENPVLLLSMEASVERIKNTLQEVLQRVEALAPPQDVHQEDQERNHMRNSNLGTSVAFVVLEFIGLKEIIKKCIKKGDVMAKNEGDHI